MASRVALFSVILCLLAPFTLAGSIQWTGGAGNNLWNFANNWYVYVHVEIIFPTLCIDTPPQRLGNAVPTANDDVIINALGGVTVSVSQPAVANSITIGGGYV